MFYIYTIPGIPESLNKFAGRNNAWEYREKKNLWTNLVKLCCIPKPLDPIEHAAVTISYYFPNRTRRDPDNYCGKMILDGLTAAGIIKDDDFDHIDLAVKKAGVDRKFPRTELFIEVLEDETEQRGIYSKDQRDEEEARNQAQD